jgi:hypothetical protein
MFKKKLGAAFASIMMITGMLLAAPSVATAAPEQPLPMANIVCGSVLDNYSSYNCSQGNAGMIRHRYTFVQTGVNILALGPWVGNGGTSQFPPELRFTGVTSRTWEWNGGCGGTCAI